MHSSKGLLTICFRQFARPPLQKALTASTTRIQPLSTTANTDSNTNLKTPDHADPISPDPPYQYPGSLTTEQRASYAENGYLVLKSLVSEGDLSKYNRRFEEYATGKRKPPSPELVLLREVSSLKAPLSPKTLYKLNELYTDEVLFQYPKLPQILDAVQSIVGPNVMMINSMLINKPPDTGTKSSRHPLHQDLYYFPFRPANRIVCAWTAMEPISRENGALVVVPGSHKSGQVLQHEKPNWNGGVNLHFDGIAEYQSLAKERVHLKMDPGDCVLFHSALVSNFKKGFKLPQISD